MLAWVDSLLWEWGDWSRKREDSGLWYPSESIEARLMREGAGAGIRRTGKSMPLPVPPSVEETERVILALPKEQMRAVKQKYFWQARDEDAAKFLGVSVGTYRRRLEQAHWFVAGNLENTKCCASA